MWNVTKCEIDKRSMGKSESILNGYLAQQWFFSLTGKSANERFLKICEIIKKKSFDQVKKEIKEYIDKMSHLREEYSNKIKNIKSKSKDIKKKYFKVKSRSNLRTKKCTLK